MPTYYFDRKDGVPVRDNKGLPFAGHSSAIEHSKEVAREIRIRTPAGDRDLYIAFSTSPAAKSTMSSSIRTVDAGRMEATDCVRSRPARKAYACDP
jgi:hypothetical protein